MEKLKELILANHKNLMIALNENSPKNKDLINNDLKSDIDLAKIKSAVFHLKDLLEIYLDNDIAGDNEDRRNKLCAVRTMDAILKRHQ